ncbi:MAG: bifunctional DNA-formamidopyrimidine glycosylase/DNA-(apurinic or apyrimidinic site) lyase, partial [Alphaproteobacteria bacterium]
MPELPEVETVRRGLQPVMEGRRIAAVELRRPDLRRPLPERLAERLTGRTVLALRRRSKYLLADLSGGETLILHLGMSGRLIIERPDADALMPGAFHHAAERDTRHDHAIFTMEDGTCIVFNDVRRFGVIDLAPTAALDGHPLLAGLGPEPLGNAFSAEFLGDRLKGRRSPVKAVLLDQGVVAGLGNIYVCEALWRAHVSPFRPAGDLSAEEVARLVDAIRTVLNEAIAAGGSSLRDYRQASGELGYFQHSFAVYGR